MSEKTCKKCGHTATYNGLEPYDSVRALFPEDTPLFDESGFRARNHIQICIINADRCIKGYFKPIEKQIHI